MFSLCFGKKGRIKVAIKKAFVRNPKSPGSCLLRSLEKMPRLKIGTQKYILFFRLAIHNADGLNAENRGLEFIDDKASYEEVAGWGVAFDRLMKNKSKLFIRFFL